MRNEVVAAFAPGRVNLIGEHTDYNQGLALPFAIAEGVTVRARATNGDGVRAHAVDLGEDDEFPLREPPGAEGWRAFVRGAVAECRRAGFEVSAADLRITGDVPRGSGLSSSAALEVALCLALLGLAGERSDRVALARLCARVENDWAGAKTGMLDQLASLFGAAETALRIDFRTLEIEPVRLRLGGWRFVVVDSGERHANASSGYNERRAQCERACELLGVETLRDASAAAVAGLPQPLRARAEHVLGENERVGEAVAALRAEDLPAVGRLLDASHASLRDLYEVSTPTVERAVARLREDGAAGARLMGGGFGGSVLGLFAPDAPTPHGGREVQPGPGAHVLSE
ncbi:MAG TPA: galactokinase family protein [Solirubrobacteraceae bacterium]